MAATAFCRPPKNYFFCLVSDKIRIYTNVFQIILNIPGIYTKDVVIH